MDHTVFNTTDKEDSHVGLFSDSVGMQTYLLNTSLGATHIMSRLNNEMSSVENTASGSFGVVMKGIFDFDSQCYAVKQTKRTISGEDDLQLRLQEVYALSACNHPNILRYFDGWVEDKAVYVRTEWLSDCSLAEFSRPLPESLLYSVIHQIATALHWLSCHHIAHRDVKPENILARKLEDGSHAFKLADFGLARPFENHSCRSTDEFRGMNDDDGDQRYLCPEAFATCGFNPLQGEADVYALGASCVELMDGDPFLVRNGHYTGSFDEYSTEMQQIVRWMTKRDPKERPTAFTLALITLDKELQTSEEFLLHQDTIENLQKSVEDLERELKAHKMSDQEGANDAL